MALRLVTATIAGNPGENLRNVRSRLISVTYATLELCGGKRGRQRWLRDNRGRFCCRRRLLYRLRLQDSTKPESSDYRNRDGSPHRVISFLFRSTYIIRNGTPKLLQHLMVRRRPLRKGVQRSRAVRAASCFGQRFEEPERQDLPAEIPPI